MKKELIGLRRYLYVFKNENEFKKAWERMELTRRYTISERFINNAYAFEAKENILIDC